MPNGSLSPPAKISFALGVAAPSAARNTRIWPLPVSATKISPFGATLSRRGSLRPSATRSILKPGGTCSETPAGRGTTRAPQEADGVAPGRRRSCGLIRRIVPGLSRRQSPNASRPFRTSGSAIAAPAANVTKDKAESSNKESFGMLAPVSPTSHPAGACHACDHDNAPSTPRVAWSISST